MSVELELKLGNKPTLFNEALRKSLSEEIGNRFPLGLVHTTVADLISERVIGTAPNQFGLTFGEKAEIQLLCYTAGTEDAIGEDGGWWVTISVVQRTSESFLFMLLASACLAKNLGTNIVDDSNLIGCGRYVSTTDIFSLLDTANGLSFEQASARVAQGFGSGKEC